MADIDVLLSASLKRIAQPGDAAGVADAIRARVDAGDTGTPATASGFGARPWWLFLLSGLLVILVAVTGVSVALGQPSPVTPTPDAASVAVSSSREVTAHLHRVGFSQVIEWPNVAEVAPYIDAASGRPPRDPELVVFGGNISPFKIDCEMIAELIRRRPHVHVVLAGPIPGGGAGWKGLDDLRELGVELVGLKSIAELAELYARATVGIIPYVETPYTRGVLPLKVNEYLAAGLSVVASNLASMSELGEDVVLARGPADFADKVIARLGPLDSADVERRQQFAARHSWVQRGDDARRLVADLLEGEGPRP